MGDLKSVFQQADERMNKAVADLDHAFNTIRTGRASTSLLDTIRIEQYGSQMALNAIATVATPDPRSITVTPWDKSNLVAIEKAIHAAGLGLNPSNDGRMIRIVIPPLSEERRKELVKLAHKMAEEHRVAIRNIRKHINDEIKKLETDKKAPITEDQSREAHTRVQKQTDEHIKKIDEHLKKKEAEIMEV